MKKITLLFAALTLLCFSVLLWYFALQKKPKDEAVFYFPQQADVLVKIHTSSLLKEAAFRPLFQQDLDEEKRALVFQEDEGMIASGIYFPTNTYLSYETFSGKPLLLAFVTIYNEKMFERYSQRKKIISFHNKKVGLLVLAGNTQSTQIQLYLKRLLAQKRASKHVFQNNMHKKDVLAEVYFRKDGESLNLTWNKSKNSLHIDGNVPKNSLCANTLCIDSANFYFSLPAAFLTSFIPDTTLQSIFSSLQSMEIAYQGSHISIQEQKVSPQASLALHFSDSIPQHLWEKLINKSLLKYYTDSILIFNYLNAINYTKNKTSLYLYAEHLDTCSMQNQGIISIATGNPKKLLNFYENTQLARLFIASKPLLKQAVFLLDNIDYQHIAYDKKGLTGEIRFSNEINAPFEAAYWLKLLELRQ